MFCSIQSERQERRKIKEELGIGSDPERKSRFEPPEPVATGISLGIKPTASSKLQLNDASVLVY